MNLLRLTRHAFLRIERGDKRGRRTTLTPREVQELANARHAVREGRFRWVYSEKDEKTLTIVTDPHNKVIKTVFDTSRYNSRLLDMVTSHRCGKEVVFTPPEMPSNYSEEDMALIGIGFVEYGESGAVVDTQIEVACYFDFSLERRDIFESHEFHELIVDSMECYMAIGKIPKWEFWNLHTFCIAPGCRFGSMPTWVSYELLDRKRPL